MQLDAAGSAVARAMSLAEVVCSSELECLISDHERNIAQAKTEEAHFRSLIQATLPIEALAKERFEEGLAGVLNRRAELQTNERRLCAQKELGQNYRQLSLEPLGWRGKWNRPLLVVFRLDSDVFSLSAGTHRKFVVKPQLPARIEQCYQDVLLRLFKQKPKNHTRHLSCRFGGLIPAETKQRIKEAEKHFKNGYIFIIAEPGEFQLQDTQDTFEARPAPISEL